jgi:hypothetical protein
MKFLISIFFIILILIVTSRASAPEGNYFFCKLRV